MKTKFGVLNVNIKFDVPKCKFNLKYMAIASSKMWISSILVQVVVITQIKKKLNLIFTILLKYIDQSKNKPGVTKWGTR